MSILQELKDNDFNFNKKFGQNFITDKNFLKSIVLSTGVGKNDDVLEIGTGAGTLTEEISAVAHKVVTYEVDLKLKDYLFNKFKNNSNIKLVFKDILKENIKNIEINFNNNYFIIANIPYYITSPIIFKFLEESKRVNSLCLMVQKEVAERIVAKNGNKNYGVLSVMVQSYGNASIIKNVSRKMFKPIPNVDSAIIKIDVKNDIIKSNKTSFAKIVKYGFSNRRKTLINNLSQYICLDKSILNEILTKLEISLTARAENLSIDDFDKLTSELSVYIK